MTEGSTSLPIAGLSTIAVGGGGGCGIGCVVDWRMSMEGRLVSFVGIGGWWSGNGVVSSLAMLPSSHLSRLSFTYALVFYFRM